MSTDRPVPAPADAAPDGSGPFRATVLRMGLGLRLRRLREAAGISREAAGDAIRGSAPKISRLELGRVGFKERDVLDLLRLYGVEDPAEHAQFLELARRANTPGWWHQFADLLPSWFGTYVGLEQAASVIRTYECQFVPGLLQTADYAREVVRLAHQDRAEVERRVELRLQRQRILDDGTGPMLWAVVDEAVLRRPLATPQLCHAQLTRLIERAEQPNVTLQVAGFGAGGLPAAGGAFTILRFAETDLPDVVYLEQLTSAVYLDRRSDVEQYASVMDRLSAVVSPPHRTRGILEGLRRELQGAAGA